MKIKETILSINVIANTFFSYGADGLRPPAASPTSLTFYSSNRVSTNLQRNWTKFIPSLRNKLFVNNQVYGSSQPKADRYAIFDSGKALSFITVELIPHTIQIGTKIESKPIEIYYRYLLFQVNKKYDHLSEPEQKLVLYFHIDPNQNPDITLWYAEGYQQNIDGLWGIKVKNKTINTDQEYCTVWIKDPKNDQQELLVDENEKVIAVKDSLGKITFESKS